MGNISFREKRRHGSVMVPYSYYECSIPDHFPMVPLHWHSEFEINYVISGKSEFTYGNKKIVTNTGDIIIVPPNILHAIYPYEDFCQIYDTVVFREEMLGVNKEERSWISCIEPLINGNYGITAPITEHHVLYEKIRLCAERIFDCCKRDTPISDLQMKSELLRLLCMLEEGGLLKEMKTQDDKCRENIQAALLFINQNYKENISIDRLTDIVHLSRSYFMYRFKQVVGVSVMEYIIHLRIKSACEMLRNTEDTSVNIAFACGFQNLSNFNRQFKKCVGCTPRQYRRLKREM